MLPKEKTEELGCAAAAAPNTKAGGGCGSEALEDDGTAVEAVEEDGAAVDAVEEDGAAVAFELSKAHELLEPASDLRVSELAALGIVKENTPSLFVETLVLAAMWSERECCQIHEEI